MRNATNRFKESHDSLKEEVADKVKKRNFVFSYKGRQLPIEKVEFKKDSLQFLAYPDSTLYAFKEDVQELLTKNDGLSIRSFEYELLNIRDSIGNNLNEYSSENLQQYREYLCSGS